MDQVEARGLEIAFGQFGFDQQLAKFQVHLTSINSAVLQWNSWPEAESRMNSRFDPQQGTDRRAAQNARVAENVHEQRVGAVGALQLPPRAICLSGEKSRAGVDLGHARF